MKSKALLIVLTFIFSTSVITSLQAQPKTCGDYIVSDKNPETGQKLIRFDKALIVSDDNGETGFAIAGLVIDNNLVLTITTKGGSSCVNQGDSIKIVFSDSSKLAFANVSEYNCKAQSLIHVNSIQDIEQLAMHPIASMQVWTKMKYVRRKFNSEIAHVIQESIACLKAQLYVPQLVQHEVLAKDSSDVNSDVDIDYQIFTVVEEMTEFVGGYNAMLDFLKKKMRFPDYARKNKVDGTVYVQFVVAKNGAITDVKVIKGMHPDLDAEALRVVSSMPNWKPGKQNGKAVFVRFVLPIRFKS